jgi:hypothetical protein
VVAGGFDRKDSQMSDVSSASERSTPAQDREAYEPPVAEDVEVAVGTTETAPGTPGSA